MSSKPLALLLFAFVLCGCTRVRGLVIDTANRPLTTAKISIGIPDGVGTFATHSVDDQGRFDFQIAPTEQSSLYIYDSAGPAKNTMRHIDSSEISENMKIRMYRNGPDVLPGMNTPL